MNRIPIRPTLTDKVSLDEIEFVITYTYTPAIPAVMYLRDGSPGYPAEPAEVDIHSVKVCGVEMIQAIPEQQLEYLYERVLEEAENHDIDYCDP